ncbi:late embryogenesis abundant protein D-34-like [Wolffia australiana]
MSQEQPIRYGQVFPSMKGELAEEIVAPRDAALMQSAENVVTGETKKGSPAAMMQSSAAKNVRSGFVGHEDITGAVAEHGVGVVETEAASQRLVSEFVAGQNVTTKLPMDKTGSI